MARSDYDHAVLAEIRKTHAERALREAILKDTPEKIGDWRTMPDAREYVRRGHAWELLAYYHHNVAREEFGIRGMLRRLWWRLRGKPEKLMSPWEQLRKRTYLEAVLEIEEAAKEGRLIIDAEGKYRIAGSIQEE